MFLRKYWNKINSMQFLFVHNLQNFFKRSQSGDQTISEIFEKLNVSAPPTKKEATAILKRLPNLSNSLIKNHRQKRIDAYKSLDNAEKSSNQQLKTDPITTETLKRFENILYGPHSGGFCQKKRYFCEWLRKIRYCQWCFVYAKQLFIKNCFIETY